MRRKLPDPVKLSLLVILLTICLATFFTSSSWELGPRGVPTIGPAVVHFKWCQEQVAAAATAAAGGNNNNNKNGSISINDDNKNKIELCQQVVPQAFRSINLGGCTLEIQSHSLCELEWCNTPTSTHLECRTECAEVRGDLERCIKQTIQKYTTKRLKQTFSLRAS